MERGALLVEDSENCDPAMISDSPVASPNPRRKAPPRRADRLRQTTIESPVKLLQQQPLATSTRDLPNNMKRATSLSEIRSPSQSSPLTLSTQKALGELRKNSRKPPSIGEVRTPVKSSPLTSTSQKALAELRKNAKQGASICETRTPSKASPSMLTQKGKQQNNSSLQLSRSKPKSSWREEQRNLELQARVLSGNSFVPDDQNRTKARSNWQEERDNYDLQDGRAERSGRQDERRIQVEETEVVLTKPVCQPPTSAEMEEIRANVHKVVLSSTAIKTEYNDAATKIATFYRDSKKRHRYLLHSSARMLQSVWRGVGPRRAKEASIARLAIENKAALRIQSARRMVVARRIIIQFKAARCIQATWRGYIPRITYWSHLRNMAAATRIQCAWRSCKCTRQYSMTVQDIVTVQRIARAYISRRRQFRNMRALDIQRVFRGHKGRKQFARIHHKYVMHCHAITIQRVIRGRIVRIAVMEARFLIRTAITIQRYWRGYTMQQDFWSYVGSVIEVQAMVRARAERKKYQYFLRCIATTQSIVRRWCGCRQLHNLRQAKSERDCSTKIQAWWRCSAERSKYLQFQTAKGAATKIQSVWRSFVCFSDYIFILSDIVTIQRKARSYIRRQHAAVAIQSAWRMFKYYTDFTIILQHVLNIQRAFRGHNDRLRYAVLYEEREQQRALTRLRERSTITIQRMYRGTCGRAEAESLRFENKKENAAIALQSLWRSHFEQSRFAHVVESVIQIQRVTRGFLGRLQFIDDLGCVILCQCAVRRWIAIRLRSQIQLGMKLVKWGRYEHILERHASTTLQRWFRSYVRPKIYFDAAAKVQSFFRMVQAIIEREVRTEMKRRLEATRRRKHAAIIVQSFWRVNHAKRELRLACEAKLRNIATVKVQSFLRMGYCILKRGELQALAHSKRCNAAAIKIQSFFRMVKAMVDKEIQEQINRRKLRKMMKNRTKELDDFMLEDAWVSMSTSYDTMLTQLLPQAASGANQNETQTRAGQSELTPLELKASTSSDGVLEDAWKSLPSEKKSMREAWSLISLSDETVLDAKRSASKKIRGGRTKSGSTETTIEDSKQSRAVHVPVPALGDVATNPRLKPRSHNQENHATTISAAPKTRLPPSYNQEFLGSLDTPPAEMIRCRRGNDYSDNSSDVSAITTATAFRQSQHRARKNALASYQSLDRKSLQENNQDIASKNDLSPSLLVDDRSVHSTWMKKKPHADLGKRHYRSRSRSREPMRRSDDV